ncbi:MAG: cobalt ECF transporter T component CbiQ [Thermoleophilia bacterium]|nr:cobalt ECF transporter T component CbiQ [Thermoleophilia bacterium]
MAEAGLSIPEWMRKKPIDAGVSRNGRRRRTSVVERTISGLSEALRSSIFSERIAARPGLLQRIDPRIKILGFLTLLIAIGLIHSPFILLGLYAGTVLLAAMSRISPGYFVKRVWLFIPLFTGVIVLPSLFNIIRPGDPLVTLWDFGRDVHLGPWLLGDSLAVTRQGATGAVIFVLRVAASVSLAVLLTLSTRWPDLLKALRVFHVPRVFVLIISMTYRYIFLLLGLATDMFTARRSRLAGVSTPREDRRFVTGSMGALLGKSQALGEEVYAAMVSRGYSGEPRTLNRFSLAGRDLVFAACVAILAVAVIGGDRIIG